MITSLDISSLIKAHNASNVLATISLYEVDDPTRFGVVKINENNKILQFQEKPKLEDAYSNLINAGTYVLNPEILEIMPEGPHSMERDVFTKIAPKGEMLGFEFEGYFVDAGTPLSWLESCKTCFESGRWSSGINQENNWIADNCLINEADLQGSYVSSNCKVQQASIIESCILSGSSIGKGSILKNTLVGEKAKIGENCNLENVIVDYNAIVPDGWKQIGGCYPNQ